MIPPLQHNFSHTRTSTLSQQESFFDFQIVKSLQMVRIRALPLLPSWLHLFISPVPLPLLPCSLRVLASIPTWRNCPRPSYLSSSQTLLGNDPFEACSASHAPSLLPGILDHGTSLCCHGHLRPHFLRGVAIGWCTCQCVWSWCPRDHAFSSWRMCCRGEWETSEVGGIFIIFIKFNIYQFDPLFEIAAG